jgi:hypothetical protein
MFHETNKYLIKTMCPVSNQLSCLLGQCQNADPDMECGSKEAVSKPAMERAFSP